MNLFAFLASLFSRKRASEPKPHTPHKPGEAQPTIGGNAEIIATRPGSSESVATRDFDRTNEPPMIVVPPPPINNAGEPWGYRLSDHFTLAEFIASDTAKARGIDNTLPPELWAAAMGTCRGLEKIRTRLGAPIILLSGYRCRRLNEAVHGAPDSDHMKALAGDIICPSFGTPYDIAKALSMLELQFDQIILEPTWVHVGFGPRMRGELLTKLKGGGYLDGIVRGAAHA